MKLKFMLITALICASTMSTQAFARTATVLSPTTTTEEKITEDDVENVTAGQEVQQGTTSTTGTTPTTGTTAEVRPWTDYFVIAHACGAVDGRTETNSVEAFLQNYEKGQRIFEVDLTVTLDNKLVARHDFEENSYYVLEQSYNKSAPVMMYEKFMATKINYKYTPMDARKIVELLNVYSDCYFITDSKDTDQATVEREFRLLKDAVENGRNDEVMDRIIVQLYYPEMKQYVDKIGGFTNYMLTLYQIQNPDYSALAKFCADNKISAMVIPEESLDEERAKIIHGNGIKLYTHTVNRLSNVRTYIAKYGIDGVYSDYITETDVQYIK